MIDVYAVENASFSITLIKFITVIVGLIVNEQLWTYLS